MADELVAHGLQEVTAAGPPLGNSWACYWTPDVKAILPMLPRRPFSTDCKKRAVAPTPSVRVHGKKAASTRPDAVQQPYQDSFKEHSSCETAVQESKLL